VIFYHSAEQERLAKEAKIKYQEKWSAPIVTAIEPAAHFWKVQQQRNGFSLTKQNRARTTISSTSRRTPMATGTICFGIKIIIYLFLLQQPPFPLLTLFIALVLCLLSPSQ